MRDQQLPPVALSRPQRVAVEVDRLILDLPVTVSIGRVVAEALQVELTRLIALDGIPGVRDLAGATPIVSTRPVVLGPRQTGGSIAREVAQVVHVALGGSGSTGRIEPLAGKSTPG